MRGDRKSIRKLQLEGSIKIDLFKQHIAIGQALKWLGDIVQEQGTGSPQFRIRHWFLRDSGLRKIFAVAMGLGEEKIPGPPQQHDHPSDDVLELT